MAELQEYNNDYKENSPLRLNLGELANKFDVLTEQTFAKFKVPPAAVNLYETHYKPELDTPFYQYKTPVYASQRKQITIDAIKLSLNVSNEKAEFIFNKTKENWLANPNNSQENIIELRAKNTLDEILADIIRLDGKVGFLGGEKRTLENGTQIKIPKGVAAIFDLYTEYKNGKSSSASKVLEAMIAQAARSNAYQGHTMFNQRQNETSTFYNDLVTIQDRKLDQNEYSNLLEVNI